MKVSFTIGAGQDVRINNIASRVLTENLTRDKNFDVKFLNFPISSAYLSNKAIPEYMDKMEQKHKIMKECTTSWFSMFKVAYGSYHHVHLLLNELTTEYLFYSCSLAMFEFNNIAALLNNGTKLIIGGTLLNNFSFKQIRNIISKKVDDKYMNNLLMIKGYVDLSTDLYSIVQKWKDYEITKNDFSTFWDCEEDYIVDKINIFKRFSNDLDLSFLDSFFTLRYSVFVLDNKCWWGKCKFCLYTLFDEIDYTGGASVEKISENIIKTLRKHGNDSIFFANDYFVFTDKYEKIMQNLVDRGIKIVIFTGIRSLLDVKYIEKINKYVSAIKLGLESFSDFSLDYIRKGYTYEDIQKALGLIKTHMNKDVLFLSNLIADLPTNSKDDVVKNYTRALEFKNEMIGAGFKLNFSTKLLVINNNIKDRFIDNKYMSIHDTINDGDDFISGRYLMFKYFKELGIIKDDIYKEMVLPILRRGDDGEKIPSDLNIISSELAKEVFTWI